MNHAQWNPTLVISPTPWVPPANRLANDRVANDKHHTEVDDLFAQWESDQLELFSFPELGA